VNIFPLNCGNSRKNIPKKLLNEEGYPYVLKGIENGLIFNATATNVLRFLPPLIVTKAEIDTAVEVLSTVLK